jgi:excisionase family DNA binding protein
MSSYRTAGAGAATPTIFAVSEVGDEGTITVRAAADLLGVRFRTVYNLIERGELAAAITTSPGPKRRKSIRVRREEVDQYLERFRIQPGALSHLNPPPTGRHGR